MTTARNSLDASPPAPDDPGFAAFSQLAKMLVPSSGSFSIYATNADLIWSSDGYERPDLRELVDFLRVSPPAHPTVRSTRSGITALTARLTSEENVVLGYVVIELGAARSSTSALSANLLKPLVECLRTRLCAEQARPQPPTKAAAGDVQFVIGVSEHEHTGPEALRLLLQRCVDNLDCESAAFVAPDHDLSVIARRGKEADPRHPEFVEQTRKHLLAWAQLNNRPMVVNRVGKSPGTSPYKILSCPVRDSGQQVTGLVALFRNESSPNFEQKDVSLLEFLCRRIVNLLRQRDDQLKGILSRTAFLEQLQRQSDRADASPSGALLHINIDRLQGINDTFGHEAGDEVISKLAALIAAVLGNQAIVARLAGDSFGAFLPGADTKAGRAAAERVLDSTSRLGSVRAECAAPVAVSIGVATTEDVLGKPALLIAAAAAAGKQARRDGGNRCLVHVRGRPVVSEDASELIAANELRQALQSGDLALVAQPIAQLEAGLPIAGYEVLVRMRDESGALLSPARFMSAARRYGLALGIDTWVFAELIRSLEAAAVDGSRLPIGIAVNVSEQSLVRTEYASSVVAAIAGSRLSGALFSFEIEEDAAVNHPEAAELLIDTLRAAGSRVALDRFGSGLTSFAHLKRLNVDYLKVGGELIRGMLQDRHNESIVYGLAKAAESLGIRMVAEHVENATLAEKLLAMGFAYGQGFTFGRPTPLAEILANIG